MTTLTKEELEKLVAVAQMVADMADGLDMAAEAEVLVIDGLDKYAALFQADDRDPKTMRALRVYNEAKSNHRRFVKEAYALRTLAAENATLRAENEELDFLRHEGGPDSVAAMEIELATLRASEAAANARADQARDAALVEAAAVAIARKGNGEATLDHPYDKGYLAACDSCAASILALRDKPAPAQCCMCGKTDLSTVEGDGGPECQLDDGRWTCSHACYDRATEEPAPAVTVGGGLCGCCGERPIAYPIEGECIECFSANEGGEL